MKIKILILFASIFLIGSILPKTVSAQGKQAATICSSNAECATNEFCSSGFCVSTTGTSGTGTYNTGVFCKDTEINTAIGCIPVLSDTNAFAGFILKWAVGVGGGIAFLLIVYAGFLIMTSQGNPERLKAGQELLTSAISGVVLLVLSVFILNIIGVKILQIPGLSK